LHLKLHKARLIILGIGPRHAELQALAETRV
jgi:hypothetical protein